MCNNLINRLMSYYFDFRIFASGLFPDLFRSVAAKQN